MGKEDGGFSEIDLMLDRVPLIVFVCLVGVGFFLMGLSMLIDSVVAALRALRII